MNKERTWTKWNYELPQSLSFYIFNIFSSQIQYSQAKNINFKRNFVNTLTLFCLSYESLFFTRLNFKPFPHKYDIFIEKCFEILISKSFLALKIFIEKISSSCVTKLNFDFVVKVIAIFSFFFNFYGKHKSNLKIVWTCFQSSSSLSWL